MKIEILEYQVRRGPKVKVQSHNFRKGKWVKNPKWDWHNKVSYGETHTMYGVFNVKRYSKQYKEVKQDEKKEEKKTRNPKKAK